jgi:hypothetical protein
MFGALLWMVLISVIADVLLHMVLVTVVLLVSPVLL